VKSERTLLLTALVTAAIPALASADHPHLFYGANDLPALRAQAGSTHKTIADGLKGGVADFRGSTVAQSADVRWSDGRTLSMGDQRDIGNALIVFAFASQLDQDPQSLAVAKGWLLTFAGWGSFDVDGQKDLTQAHLLGGVAVAYDMLYPSLSDSERDIVRNALSREADSVMAACNSGLWWANSFSQNHNWIDHAAVGLAALALDGEVDAAKTQAWLSFAVDNAKKANATIDGITDGTWHEGYSYLAYGFQWHLPFLDALRRSGRDDLTQLPILRGIGAARAHMQIAEQPERYVLASGDFTSFMQDEGLLALRFAGSRLKDGTAQAAADRWSNGVGGRKTYAPEMNQAVFEFLFYDPSVPAADLSSAPLDWYGADLGAVIFRSGWDKGSTLFALKSGTFGGRSVWSKLAAGQDVGALNFSHDHADDNAFYLYANGAWAAPEAEGYYIGHPDSPGPQANQTSFHNSMLVDGQGQLGSGVRDHGDDGQSYDWFFQREGKIPFHGSTDHFAFATGDGSKLYPSNLGVTQWDRHALFLDRKHVVLFDAVQASQPRTWSWLSHFTGNAWQEGSWIHGQGDNGQALGVAVVAPQNPGISFSNVSPLKANNFDQSGNFSGAEVKSPASAKTAFLTALVPVADANWGSRPTVDPLDQGKPEAGLVLVDGDRRSAAAFSADGSGVQAGNVTLAGLAGVAETKGGAVDRALLVRGTSIAQDGKELLHADGGVDVLEADGISSDTVWLSGSALKNARVYAPTASKIRWYGQDVQFRRDGDYAVVSLSQALTGQTASGDAGAGAAGTAAAGSAKAGGGCGAAGPGDLAAVAAVLLALYFMSRSRRRPAVIEVKQLPARKEKKEKVPADEE